MEENVTGLKTLLHMWKHIFDYKGKASKSEYWTPLFVYVGIGVLTFLFALAGALLNVAGAPKAICALCVLVALLLLLYLLISIPAWISLTVRRLHDTGKSGWWTILLLVVGAGTCVVLFMCSLGSFVSIALYDPSINMIQGIYGPPEMFDPSNNQLDDIYGPPEMFDDYDPELNVEPDIYGPPEMFEDED